MWAVIKISYNPQTLQAEGGICGSAFFVNKRTFVSARHCFNESTFNPNEGFPKVKVILANEKGKIIRKIRIRELIPDYDLTIGEIDESTEDIEVPPIAKEFSVGDSVQNIGYPIIKGFADYSLRIKGSDLIIDQVSLKKLQQEGEIEKLPSMTVRANDVNFENKDVIVLSYTSELGFSGGPLLLRSSRKVIGMMSLVIPENIDHRKPAVAVRISDILKFIKSK